ncbi:MAG: DUF3822 family protein [Bacteroidota bacterium]
MGKISTSVVKTSFSIDKIANYKLSILCGIDSLSYCIRDQSNTVLILKQFDLFTDISGENEARFLDKLGEVWTKESMLALPFPDVHIAFVHPHFTLVPNKLYQSDKKAVYLDAVRDKPSIPYSFYSNSLPSIAATLVFNVPQFAIDFFESKYKHPHYYNSVNSLVNKIAHKRKNQTDKQVWLNIYPSRLQIALFEGPILLFANQFEFQSENDFLYYVLLVYNQFKLAVEKTPLLISGQLVKQSAIYKKLYRYIRNLSFVSVSDTYQLTTHLTEKPPYFFFDLLSVGENIDRS